MGKSAHLVMVTALGVLGNNKFYTMTENSDGNTFTAEYGRVGKRKTTKEYSMSQWEKKFNEKLKKGYKDQTDMVKISTSKVKFKDITDPIVHKVFSDLMRWAKRTVSENYTVDANQVTQKQIDMAQKILDDIVGISKPGKSVITLNKRLIDLYTTIPRAMSNVKDHVFNEDKITKSNIINLNNIITSEQDKLDAMASQVSVSEIETENTSEEVSLLDAMGLSIIPTTDKEKKIIKVKMGPDSNKFVNAYRIINKKTSRKFFECEQHMKNKHKDLLWHGSRNENWLNICDKGLMIRPSCAVLTGAMFGNGCYFADKAKKSMGYTSSRGSYWANGSANQAFFALYDVILGDMLEIVHHKSWCYSLDYKNLKARGKFDSLFAKGGADLINNEFIVYDVNQTNIAYLVEFN